MGLPSLLHRLYPWATGFTRKARAQAAAPTFLGPDREELAVLHLADPEILEVEFHGTFVVLWRLHALWRLPVSLFWIPNFQNPERHALFRVFALLVCEP